MYSHLRRVYFSEDALERTSWEGRTSTADSDKRFQRLTAVTESCRLATSTISGGPSISATTSIATTKRTRPGQTLISAIFGHLNGYSLQDCKEKSKSRRLGRDKVTTKEQSVHPTNLNFRMENKSEYQRPRQEQQKRNDHQVALRARALNQNQGDTIEEKELHWKLRTRSEMHLSDLNLSNQLSVERHYCFIETSEETGKSLNIVEGIELWENFLTEAEESNLLSIIYEWEKQGENGKLVGATFAAPRKWKRGKGRRTIQFGCCYNYSRDWKGRPPGILEDEIVEQMPSTLQAISDRLVRWNIVPAHRRPDSAIVNIYEEGDCIPPHIDHNNFLRPFVTISLLSESPISFGLNIKPHGPGEFDAPCHISLPRGSCLVLNGNGADKAKHCVAAVKQKRVSITLRKMDPAFVPKALP